ncbi:MAG: transglutaminase domain-containing protein [candidate division KSB1 bacterium]|nr:transglutaminase domain-containing protein [candidate division KSB1 bacterium]
MKTVAIRLSIIVLGLASVCAPKKEVNVQETVDRLEREGRFREAEAFLDSLLQVGKLAPPEAEQLRWEKERLRRIRLDYSLGRAELLAQLQQRVEAFREEELRQWEGEGRLDYRVIDGETRYLYASVSNLFWRYPEIRARQLPRPDRRTEELELYKLVREVLAAGRESPDRFVLPRRFRCTHTVRVQADAVPAGRVVRCWIPYPRAFPFQTDIRLVAAEPFVAWLAQPEAPARSVYLERVAEAGKATIFRVTYEYTSYATVHRLDPDKVEPYDTASPLYRYYTAERPPHVVFRPEFRALLSSIVGEERNPLRVARAIYDWIADNLLYSYAHEYSTLRNISLFTLEHRYGDCGQKALLYITLCRLSGIPARWQSGWTIRPGHKSMHDWCEIYIEPYGWIPVDPDRGAWAQRYIETLSPEEKRTIVDFFFGNLDPYHMAANCDHQAPLYPPKTSFRSDDVDFQRAEVECDGENVYFDKFDYELEVEPL